MPAKYVLPLLILDASGARVGELETATVGDLDEQRRAIRVLPTFEKNEWYRYVDLPDDLFGALTATLPPREDRKLDAPLFPDLTDADHYMYALTDYREVDRAAVLADAR